MAKKTYIKQIAHQLTDTVDGFYECIELSYDEENEDYRVDRTVFGESVIEDYHYEYTPEHFQDKTLATIRYHELCASLLRNTRCKQAK